MKKLHTFFLLMLCSLVSFAQFFPQNSGTTEWLGAIQFSNPNSGYIGGQYGMVLKTNNAGINWQPVTNVLNNVNTIYVVDTSNIYAAGDWGLVYNTTNGGMNWTIQRPFANEWLFSIFFTDIITGYAVGGFTSPPVRSLVINTTNGGKNWNLQTIDTIGFLMSVCFPQPNLGYIVGENGMIFKTTNSGANWVSQISGTIRHLISLSFINENIGYAVGHGGVVLKTTNGGTNWNAQLSNINNNLYAVNFIGNNYGYAIGSSGSIIKTTNAGVNWVTLNSNTNNELYGLSFTDSVTGYITGGHGIILKTTNGGGTFINEYLVPESSFILYPNPSTNKTITITNNADFPKETLVNIFNIQGEQVFSKTFYNQNSMEIDVSSLAKGAYLVKILSEKVSTTKKLVIQ